MNQLSLHDEPGWKRTPVAPERPPLGTELIDEMQRQLRICVALGTISLESALQLYRDWLFGD